MYVDDVDIKNLEPSLLIYFPSTLHLNNTKISKKINEAIEVQNFTNLDTLNYHSFIDTLTIITQKQIIQSPHYPKLLSETFKEDTCVICLDKDPNIMFCDCGHLVICK